MRQWPQTSSRTARSRTRTQHRTPRSTRATKEAGDGQEVTGVQKPQPRGAQRTRRRGAAGACCHVADQRERGRTCERSCRIECTERQLNCNCQCGADRQHHAVQLAKGEWHMGNEPQEYRSLTREELNALAGEELPERAAMSLINANVAAPINAAVALNVLSDGSVAYANAEQTANITQSNL